MAVILLAIVCAPAAGLGKSSSDDDDDDAKQTSQLPNIYLDWSTIYTSVPAGSFTVGFRSSLALLPTSSLSMQSLALNLPLTVDVTDRLTVYGGINASTTLVSGSTWTPLAVDSWNVGFQADVIQQNGGLIPTVTVQTTLTQSIGSTITTTSSANIVELDYAMDKDETRGILAGVKYTTVSVDSSLIKIEPAIIGFVGGYHQWPNNWKLTGRAGIQSFGGAQLAGLVQFKPFTLPILRLDLDRMDDNDNRLFGLTAEVAWTPDPTFQMTLRTPLYAVRH
ncbi:MAG: hypothetical protein EPO23_05680 [Xanthobacteraceae bacterium]|nr:MAG: hypothetical protein EPO23_05680 [Xanthobacteraceae bacterium]